MALGTTAALIGASAIGGIAQASAANRAADAQEAAANRQIEAANETRDIIRADLAPYREGGLDAQNALRFELGLGDRPDGYRGYEASPYANYLMTTGRDNIEAGAAYGGSLYSGRTMQALEQYRQGVAGADRNTFVDRLTGVANSGQNAAAQTAAAETNQLNALTTAYGNIGNAQAAGAVGVGNALSGAINNGIGIWGYQQGLANPTFGGAPMTRPPRNAFATGAALY